MKLINTLILLGGFSIAFAQLVPVDVVNMFGMSGDVTSVLEMEFKNNTKKKNADVSFFTFDKQNRLISKKVYSSRKDFKSNKYNKEESFLYRETGIKLKNFHMINGSGLDTLIVNDYNELGVSICNCVDEHATGKRLYDSNGNISEIYEEGDAKLYMKWEYQYVEGALISYTLKRYDGESLENFKQYNKFGKVDFVLMFRHDNNIVVTDSIKYNENGIPIEKIKTINVLLGENQIGSQKSKELTAWEYDKSGHMLSEKVFDENGAVQNESFFNYEFDERDNWIKMYNGKDLIKSREIAYK